MENRKDLNNLSLEEITKLIEKTKQEIAMLKYNINEKCDNIEQILDNLENKE